MQVTTMLLVLLLVLLLLLLLLRLLLLLLLVLLLILTRSHLQRGADPSSPPAQPGCVCEGASERWSHRPLQVRLVVVVVLVLVVVVLVVVLVLVVVVLVVVLLELELVVVSTAPADAPPPSAADDPGRALVLVPLLPLVAAAAVSLRKSLPLIQQYTRCRYFPSSPVVDFASMLEALKVRESSDATLSAATIHTTPYTPIDSWPALLQLTSPPPCASMSASQLELGTLAPATATR